MGTVHVGQRNVQCHQVGWLEMADDYILYRSYPCLRWWINWHTYQCPKSIQKREYVQAVQKATDFRRSVMGDALTRIRNCKLL